MIATLPASGNRAFPRPLAEVAQAHGAMPAQVALAWVRSRGENVIPIPGMERRSQLGVNVAAAGDRSTPEVARRAGRESPDGGG